MSELPDRPRWSRHVLHRSARPRTTWTFRVGLAATLALLLWLTQGWWIPAIGRSLICEPSTDRADALLLENFDQDVSVFERATTLRRAGRADRVIVPVAIDARTGEPDAVKLRITQVMADFADLGPFDVVSMREVEPISLNAASDIGRALASHSIRSVIVVSPLFRSRRSALVYSLVLGRDDVKVQCEPALAPVGPADWTNTWHGVQEVAQQWIKLKYYQWYVLPFGSQQ